MVQIDVSDWAYDDLDTNEVDDSYRNNSKHRSVTYQVYVKNADDSYTLTDNRKFWYNSPLTVSSVLVRQADADHYTIDRVVLDPSALGNPTVNDNDEYQFSLDLSQTEDRNATVKIYVSPKVQSVQLTYDLNGGTIDPDIKYTLAGWVYPDVTITTPTVEKDNCTFDGWYTDEALTQKWTGTTMPNENLTLYAKWINNSTPVEPEPELTSAKYFVLLPTRNKPDDNHDQGEEFYLPSSKSNGGVDGLDQSTGYIGSLTQEGAEAVPNEGDSVTDIVNGVSPKYLNVPSNLGFFDEGKWTGNTYNGNSANTSILGENFNVKSIRIVWYTIKNQGMKNGELDIHVDGYVAGVPVTVTYHPNYGTIPGMSADDQVVPATSGKTHTVSDNKFPVPNGYTFGGWYTDAACTEGKEVAVGSTETLRTDCHLYAKWVPNKFAVSYFVDNVQDGETEEHAVGTDVTVKATPTKTGYTFAGWTPAIPATMPAENMTIKAQWRYNGGGSSGYSYYTIKATAGAGGSISPSGNVSVREGRDQTFTITPDKGYAVANVKIDGKSIGAVKSYTFENVRRTHTIEVIFMKANGTPQTGVFVDVATGSYYEDAVDWAVENGITKGTDDTHFSPDGICTRAQAVTFLWRAAGSPKPETRAMPFTDVPVGSYYYDAVLWAVENGITKGTSDTTFSPNMTCTRAQIVAFLWRSEKSPAAGTANPFADVKSDAYYADAVLWAVKENITKGTTSTTFSPNAGCTRAQIVTFLYRAYQGK